MSGKKPKITILYGTSILYQFKKNAIPEVRESFYLKKIPIGHESKLL